MNVDNRMQPILHPNCVSYSLRLTKRSSRAFGRGLPVWKYADGVLVELPYPTDDTRLLTKAAQEGVERVYRKGFRCSKAEVLLLDLSQRN